MCVACRSAANADALSDLGEVAGLETSQTWESCVCTAKLTNGGSMAMTFEGELFSVTRSRAGKGSIRFGR